MRAVVALVAIGVLIHFYCEHLVPIWRELTEGVFEHRRLAVAGLVALPVLWLASWYAVLFQDDLEGGVVEPSRRGFYVVTGCLGIAICFLIAYAVVAAEKRKGEGKSAAPPVLRHRDRHDPVQWNPCSIDASREQRGLHFPARRAGCPVGPWLRSRISA